MSSCSKLCILTHRPIIRGYRGYCFIACRACNSSKQKGGWKENKPIMFKPPPPQSGVRVDVCVFLCMLRDNGSSLWTPGMWLPISQVLASWQSWHAVTQHKYCTLKAEFIQITVMRGGTMHPCNFTIRNRSLPPDTKMQNYSGGWSNIYLFTSIKSIFITTPRFPNKYFRNLCRNSANM